MTKFDPKAIAITVLSVALIGVISYNIFSEPKTVVKYKTRTVETCSSTSDISSGSGIDSNLEFFEEMKPSSQFVVGGLDKGMRMYDAAKVKVYCDGTVVNYPHWIHCPGDWVIKIKEVPLTEDKTK